MPQNPSHCIICHQETDFLAMVRSRDWKLVHFLDAGYGQLFDLANDPGGEMRNLWSDPAAANAKRELLDALRKWRMQSQCRTRGWR